MKSRKKLVLSAFIVMSLSCGTAFAQTCFDPNYGYYDCGDDYYYPDQAQAFVGGAFVGVVIGGYGAPGYGYGGGHWGGGHEGGWHGGGGGGWHGGGGHGGGGGGHHR